MPRAFRYSRRSGWEAWSFLIISLALVLLAACFLAAVAGAPPRPPSRVRVHPFMHGAFRVVAE